MGQRLEGAIAESSVDDVAAKSTSAPATDARSLSVILAVVVSSDDVVVGGGVAVIGDAVVVGDVLVVDDEVVVGDVVVVMLDPENDILSGEKSLRTVGRQMQTN